VAAHVGRRILAALRAPFSVDGRLLEIHGSIGAAISEAGAGSVGDLLGRADQARRRTKAAGGDDVLVSGHCTGAPSLPPRRALAA
jgi:GGDEF domain-containing protein